MTLTNSRRQALSCAVEQVARDESRRPALPQFLRPGSHPGKLFSSPMSFEAFGPLKATEDPA
jgi:hypothetical protein